MPIAGDTQVSIPLTNKVGNTLMSELDGTWSPWESNADDTWANDFWWNEWGYTGPAPTVQGGSIFFTALPPAATNQRSVLWYESEGVPGEYSQGYLNLTDNSLFFRWKPFMDADGDPLGSTSFQALDIGFHDSGSTYSYHYFYAEIGEGGGSPFIYFSMNVEWWDNTDPYNKTVDLYEESQIAYDEDYHRWLRLRHDEASGMLYFETAGPACGGWTVRESIGPVDPDVRFNEFYIEVIHDVTLVPGDDPVASGAYFGPLNETRTEYTMPLTNLIDDLILQGSTQVSIPLTNEVNNY